MCIFYESATYLVFYGTKKNCLIYHYNNYKQYLIVQLILIWFKIKQSRWMQI